MAVYVPLPSRRRILMGLKEATEVNTEMGTHLSTLAEQAGLTMDEARFCCAWLVENGYARCVLSQTDNNALVAITIHGIDEVERLKMPAWKRVVKTPEFGYYVVGAFFVAIVAGLIVKYL